MKAKFAFSKKKLPAAIKIERLRKGQNFICKAKTYLAYIPPTQIVTWKQICFTKQHSLAQIYLHSFL